MFILVLLFPFILKYVGLSILFMGNNSYLQQIAFFIKHAIY